MQARQTKMEGSDFGEKMWWLIVENDEFHLGKQKKSRIKSRITDHGSHFEQIF